MIIPSLTVLNKNMQFSSLRTNLVTDQCLNITENINIKNKEVEGVNVLMKAFVLKDNRGVNMQTQAAGLTHLDLHHLAWCQTWCQVLSGGALPAEQLCWYRAVMGRAVGQPSWRQWRTGISRSCACLCEPDSCLLAHY